MENATFLYFSQEDRANWRATAADVEIIKCDTGKKFTTLLDDLLAEFDEDNEGPWYNRADLAEAFKNGTLYFLRDARLSTCNRVKDGRGLDFMSNEVHLKHRHGWEVDTVPAFAAPPRQGSKCGYLWIAKRWRGFGYGRAFVEKLGVRQVRAITEAIPFWRRLGFVSVAIGGNFEDMELDPPLPLPSPLPRLRYTEEKGEHLVF